MSFSVDYYELHGWPRTRWDRGEFDAERKVRVAWSDRVQFLLELDTYPNFFYPYGDGPSEAIVRRAHIEPFGMSTAAGGANLAQYEWSIVTFWHSTRGPQYHQLTQGLVRERLFPAAQYSNVGRQKLKWANRGVHPHEQPRRDTTLYEYSITFYQLPAVPNWVLIRPGVCNANVVGTLLMGIAFAVETVKYNGATINASWSLGRQPRFDVTANYMVKLSEWNKFWKPDGNGSGGEGQGAWETLYVDDGVRYIQHAPIVF